ncbi:DNA phosphorothioation-dependent restriction protein DptH [Clostridium sp. ZS2]|uniref:DNA phosphorothioation-dependent restriction protein DptH n=1 Tax=Clostridium sp. ZS2 TaxID=2949988 RepID=UPI00207A45BA|nr:DNA phosphorothioation-dependent restriction protein DptH [Clostridium sp. ZS2]
MSSQFYSYLSEQIMDFFNNNPLSVGAKYNIQFENEGQVKNLYENLKHNNTLCEEFEYRDLKGEVKYTSYALKFNNVKLIVAATVVSSNNEKIQPDFLTRLRNMVGVEKGYEDKAILFIHDTTLDSIIGGTESFSKEGMPFHINSIQRDIQAKIATKNFSDVDKAIINMDLDRKRKELIGDSISIFEYKELLAIINETCIEKDKYKYFGLFYDSELKNYSGKQLKTRLNENAYNFNRVDEIHNYGNPDTQLDRYYDDKGVDELKKDEWKSKDFKDVKKYLEDKIKTKPLEFNECTADWDREEGTSKVKSRLRNIMIFNEDGNEIIEQEFSFDDTLYKNGLTVAGDVEAITSGRKIKATLKNCDGNANFYKINYKSKDNIKFEFRIAVVSFNEKYFESIKTKFSICYGKKASFINVNTNDSFIVFNEFAQNPINYQLNDNYETIGISDLDQITVKIGENFAYENDSDVVTFKVDINNCKVPFAIVGTSEKTVPIEGIKVWKLKREKKCDFKFVGENKLQHGTKEYFTRDEFRKNLQLEKMIIELNGMSFNDYGEGLECIDLELDDDINEAYFSIVRYFENNNKLPSLAHLNDQLKGLYVNFIDVYKRKLNEIPEKEYLTKKQKNLFKIGMIKREIEDKEIVLTPLHPLNIAYQLHLCNEVHEETMEDEILKKFSSTYLMPYITVDEKKLYIPVEQTHSPEWKYYVDERLPRYKSSRDFVSKLVYEKIDEFVDHFKYLFNVGCNAPIKINLINTGDSKEILQGIFKYYLSELKDAKLDILPMDIYIYSNKNITNAFEEVAFNDDIKDLKETYGLNLNVSSMSEEDVLDLYREKVHFYSKKAENGIEYSHITFIEMNNEITENTANMDDIPSGIILNGLISGVPSVFTGDYYRTGFGTKFANTETDLINIAGRLNAVNVASTGAPFDSNLSKVISVPNSSRLTLEDVYNSSHWITFIDPKVDLNFFKNDPGAKDLLIIHYSDQYTTAGGYDAITVTRKSGPYQKVIEEFLSTKGVEEVKKHSAGVINMFNAINGDWLLKLISSKSYAPKEKISILSAVKLAIAKLKKDNFIWVPISLEEVLRVSGGAGLKQSEGFLSAKKLGFEGSTSDDLLLVGIEKNEDQVLVHYYPIEVKMGYKDNDCIAKGIEQAKATKKIFTETLLAKEDGKITATQKVYRNFLMQLVITSAEKLNLYSVCDEENWNSVIDTDLRRKLLNEQYVISNGTDESLGIACVISFKSGNNNESIELRKEDNVMVMEMSENDGFNFVTKTVSQIRDAVGVLSFESSNDLQDNSVNDDQDGNDNNQGVSIDGIKYTVVDATKPDGEKPDDESTDNIQIAEPDEIVYTKTPEVILTKPENKKPESVADNQDKDQYKTDRNMKILFGTNQKSNGSIYWCPNDTDKLMHTNTGIIGTMGTGKTQFTKSMVTQIYRESKYNVDGKNIGILIFDYKGDYNKSKQDFIDATDAKVFELYHLPFNPLSIIKAENSKPMLPLHTASTLKETLANAFNLGPKQENLLKDLIMEAYDKKGIIKNLPDTWSKQSPTFKDVYDVYMNHEEIKKDDSLYAAFSSLIDFEIFEPDGNKTKGLFDLIDGVTVIDLSGYDPGVQNLVAAITLDLFYSQMQAYGHSKIDGSLRQINKMVLVDEADNFLSKNFSSLKKILKEGREFGVGTILSTQLLSHFSTSENEYANYILTWVVHNVADLSNKDVRYIFNTQSKGEEENLYSKIKSLNKHYSIVKMGDSDRAVFMKDRAFWELNK